MIFTKNQRKYITIGLALVLTLCIVQKSMAERISQFAQNVTTHVLYHELAHALIREFELPVLANEEAMADSFANVYITQRRRDDAPKIILDRVKSWLYEDKEVDPKDYDFKGEHPLDIRRAYQAACQFYGADPAEWEHHVAFLDFSENDFADCSDSMPDQIDGWGKILYPYRAKKSKNVKLIYGEASMNAMVQESRILERFLEDVRMHNWPNKITIRFDKCEGGANWSREVRTIKLCDDYVKRFIEQGKAINN